MQGGHVEGAELILSMFVHHLRIGFIIDKGELVVVAVRGGTELLLDGGHVVGLAYLVELGSLVFVFQFESSFG